MDAKTEKLALFRYGLIANLVIEALPRGELTRRAQEIAARHYDIPGSKRSSVSVDTLLDWAVRYRNGGFEALAPKPRQDRGQSRAVTPQLASLIERLKRENPHRSGATLLRELALSAGQDAPALSASCGPQKQQSPLSCLLHQAVFVMQSAQHRRPYDAMTGRQFVSVTAVRNVGRGRFRKSRA